MTFKEWKAYWKKMDWTQKWFALFILLRPIIDNFYSIKNVSTFLSPIYIVGILTPVFAISSLLATKRKRISNPADEAMRIWGIFVLFNCLVFVITRYSIDNLGNAIKYVTPVLLFFYLRSFIQSKEDLKFLLQTFLYSCIFPFGMMYFEILLHPINPEYASAGRGGGERIRGEYADSMNYAIYIIGSFLVYSYFFLDDIYNKRIKKKASIGKLVFWFIVCSIGAISIRHVATWVVFLTIISMLMFYNSRNLKGMVFIAFIGLIVLPFFAREIYETQIYPLIAKEFSVLSGENDIMYSFNGRMSRWERYFQIWGNMSQFSHFIGVCFSNFPRVSVMISGGMHNDFIRILFLSGIIGLLAYISFFILVAYRKKFLRIPERFLLLSSVLILILYSISALPTLYPGLLNILYPIFCYGLLPVKNYYSTTLPSRVVPKADLPPRPIYTVT
jgi:O-antigen ligase